MANEEHLEILKQDTGLWNKWREQHPEVRPDLSYANLSKADLSYANLSYAKLSGANLSKAILSGADLREANLSGAIFSGATLSQATLSQVNLSRADLSRANLSQAILSGADLREANLSGANLSGANLSGANLSGANLSQATLININLRGADLNRTDLHQANLFGAYLSWADFSDANLSNTTLFGAYLREANLSRANLSGADLSRANLSGAKLRKANFSWANLSGANLSRADLTGCFVYATSVWDVQLEETIQANLIITAPTDTKEPSITVDNLEVAQFIYLLLNNKKIRDVIDTITTKVVLILGRFTPERKVVLDALRDELRRHGYLPILFEFEKPSSRNLTETVSTLAHFSRFIIADLTEPRSIPNELRAIIPILRVPVQSLLHIAEEPYGMFKDFQDYPWVLPTYRYTDLDTLLASLQENVINPAERKAQELTKPS